MHYRRPRKVRGRKGGQKTYLQRKWLKTSQILRLYIHPNGPNPMPSKQDFTMTHYNQIIKKPKRQNFGSSKRKDSSNTREPHKGISRNVGGTERVRWCVQKVERKKLQNKNTIHGRASCQRRRRNKDTFKQIKAEEVHH